MWLKNININESLKNLDRVAIHFYLFLMLLYGTNVKKSININLFVFKIKYARLKLIIKCNAWQLYFLYTVEHLKAIISFKLIYKHFQKNKKTKTKL